MVTISNELLLAILSMDAYNRNYFPSITDQGLPNVGMSGSQIGTATLLEIPRPSNYQSASFFAQAYTLANGQTVISYRGTDQPITDILTGYGTGAGFALDTQAEMAIQFYKDVVAAQGQDVILTGHSMGGGLAGLVASLYGKQGFLFDNMPFQATADRLYGLYTGTTTLGGGDSSDLSAAQFLELVYGASTPTAPNFNNITNTYIPAYGASVWTNWLDFIRSVVPGALGYQTIASTALEFPSDVPLGWSTYNRVGEELGTEKNWRRTRDSYHLDSAVAACAGV